MNVAFILTDYISLQRSLGYDERNSLCEDSVMSKSLIFLL